MYNCPLKDKWAIAVWDGDNGTDTEQALATCGEGSVAVAYSIDSQTQVWSGWFADQPGISNLTVVSNMQGLIAFGTVIAPPPTATPTPSPTPTRGRIAFGSNRDGNFEIYVMNADGSGQTRLTNNPAADYSAAW